MKKIVSILLVIMLLITACGSNKTAKSEEELKEELKKEVMAEMKAEDIETEEPLKTFNEVYSSDLVTALDYFNENLDKFSDDEKKTFANEIIKELSSKYMMLLDLNMGEYIIPETAFVPMYPVLDDDLYDFYDFTTNEFNLSYFKTNQTHALDFYEEVVNNDLFTISFNIWADSGVLQPNTFVPIVKPDIYGKFTEVIRSIGDEHSLPECLPNMEYNGVDSIINSTGVSYPKALMHNFDEVKELKDKETWKTELLLPVKIVEKEVKAAKKDNVFYPEDLTNGTKVSDKFTIENFYSGDMGGESISYELKSNSFAKCTLIYDKEYKSYSVRIEENVFNKKILVKDMNSPTGEAEIEFTNLTFPIKMEESVLAEDFIVYLQNDEYSYLQGEVMLSKVVHEETPMEGILYAVVSEFKPTDDELEKIYSNKDGNTPDVYLTGFKNETLYSEDSPMAIDYTKYSLVVVPMQESINIDKLKTRLVDVTSTGNEGALMFSVFGKLNSATITYTKNGMDSKEEPQVMTIENIENECIILNAEMPTDFSFIRIDALYQYQSGIEGISFSLDDARDPVSHKILTVDAYSFSNEDY